MLAIAPPAARAAHDLQPGVCQRGLVGRVGDFVRALGVYALAGGRHEGVELGLLVLLWGDEVRVLGWDVGCYVCC